ncbi:MAG: glycoside hydrolase family 31 protein [Brevinema sp.]
MGNFVKNNCGLLWNENQETIQLSALHDGSIRVSGSINYNQGFEPLVLLENVSPIDVKIVLQQDTAELITKKVRVVITKSGIIRFYKIGKSIPFLEEIISPRAYNFSGRVYRTRGDDTFKATVSFISDESEKFYGLGQHQHGRLNQKGLVIPLEQRNSEISIPFMISNKMYGFLWNNQAVGEVQLTSNKTVWIANKTKYIDYVVMIGDNYKEIMNEYAYLTGLPSVFPSEFIGFWQCKLRYRTQEELLNVARQYHRKKIPISVIVIDFFHWSRMGEWNFDPICWPDPKAMIEELNSYGIHLMVSIWPTVNPDGKYTKEMLERGYLLTSERGHSKIFSFLDIDTPLPKDVYYYDPSTPEARKYFWNIVKKNYLDRGVALFWLDACEPELRFLEFDHIRMRIGNMEEKGLAYPRYIQQTFYDGMKESNIKNPLNLCRSAWAGSHRFGAAVWSGDIDSTFESFRSQIVASQNMAMSGIPWWTTDIGGFYGGRNTDPIFQELIVRWFAWGVFCPIFRLHGNREHDDIHFADDKDPREGTGDHNELWTWGEKIEQILSSYIHLRTKLTPYILKQMKITEKTGVPLIRPLFMEFFDQSSFSDYQYMFGEDLLVAPTCEYGSTKQKVYLPKECTWYCLFTDQKFEGGQEIMVDTPLDRIPVFYRKGCKPF